MKQKIIGLLVVIALFAILHAEKVLDASRALSPALLCASSSFAIFKTVQELRRGGGGSGNAGGASRTAAARRRAGRRVSRVLK